LVENCNQRQRKSPHSALSRQTKATFAAVFRTRKKGVNPRSQMGGSMEVGKIVLESPSPSAVGNRRYLLHAMDTLEFQNELELIVGGKAEESAHYRVTAVLVPEYECSPRRGLAAPLFGSGMSGRNPSNRRAVRVEIDDYLVGYLDGQSATDFFESPPTAAAAAASMASVALFFEPGLRPPVFFPRIYSPCVLEGSSVRSVSL
jgi:hypothetical protein